MITDIHLQQFRSYQDESFELSPAVNIIVGPNASGKTNLLEAILIISKGKSYRTKDIELVKFNKDWARLESHSKDSNRTVKIKTQDGSSEKTFDLDGRIYKRLSLQNNLPAVLFEPNDLLILSGAPDLRRQFLDDLLEQTAPNFGGLRRQYKRTLAQRNALLKKGIGTKQQLFAWDIRLSELGAHAALARQQLVKEFDVEGQKIYRSISSSQAKVRFEYHTKINLDNYATDLLKKLQSNVEVDYERGFTTHGPHRDDLYIYIDDHLMMESASRGEVRTLLLVCKIIETKLIEKARNHKPMLLLDDVFSELDGARRQALTNFIKPYQSFITTTDADVVVQHFTESTAIIPL